MLFRVILGLVLASLAFSAAGSPAPLARTLPLTAAFTLLPSAFAAFTYIRFRREKRRLAAKSPSNLLDATTLFARLRVASRFVEFAVLPSYAGALFTGWNSLPRSLGLDKWLLLSGALLLVPFILSLLITWIVLYAAEMRLRDSGPTLAQRLAFKLRHDVLTVCVPVGALLAFYDLVSLLPDSLQHFLENPYLAAPLTFTLVLGGYALAPLVVVRIWKTSSLPDCPLRERLTALCRSIGVGFRDIRVWETPGHFFANAAVMGLAGPVRFILISRSLMDSMPPDELEAVFAHELGHAKRHHMPYYLAFAVNFMLLASIFETFVGSDAQSHTFFLVVWGAAFLAWWGLGFGYFSRAFERDADLFGADHSASCETFAVALQRIAHLNGVSIDARSWRHGSIRSRVAFLSAAEVHPPGRAIPDVRRRFLRRVDFLKIFLVTNALVCLAAIAAIALIF